MGLRQVSPGEEATKEAIARGAPMTTWEYYRAQRIMRVTKKRIMKGKAPRLSGYRPVPGSRTGSFGDIDHG